MVRRLGVVLVALVLAVTGPSLPNAGAASPPLPSYLDLPADVTQVLTVTSSHWSDTRARLSAWSKDADGWHLVHGPVTVRLGWNGWVRAAHRRQDTGTTPAGMFALPMAFGNRVDPGTALRYTHVDSDDMWPYEPRDPATYNIYQPRQAATSHWRSDYRERLASYGYEYAYAAVIGPARPILPTPTTRRGRCSRSNSPVRFNLPTGVHWSGSRQQYVASRTAHVHRGGCIFLHVQRSRYTAGCVAGPIDDIRWVLRWLDPAARPRIAMGPRGWVVRTL